MDKVPKNGHRISYAKVCVETNMKDGFFNDFELEMPNGEVIFVKVELPWWLIACKWCKTFGQDENHCLHGQKENPKEKNEDDKKKEENKKENGKWKEI